eukprot:COSAG02_NODE_21069_length_804_cov_1.017021_3_plen_58_part_01
MSMQFAYSLRRDYASGCMDTGDPGSDPSQKAGRARFFKQKTAYEISECDWSSDVCSSD